jgi:hypothetical protein
MTISIAEPCHMMSCCPTDPTRYRFSPRWSADNPDLSSLLWTIQFKWSVQGDRIQLEITRGPRDRKRVRVCSLPRSLLDSQGTGRSDGNRAVASGYRMGSRILCS